MQYKNFINQAWEDFDSFDKIKLNMVLNEIITYLENGTLQSAEIINSSIVVHDWVKKAILLFFKTKSSILIESSIFGYNWYDKVELQNILDFEKRKIRIVPGSIVRRGAYIGNNVVIMPSFINIGSSIGNSTMIDSGVTIGSCAQIGNNCHISSNVVIAGVLEPLQDAPVCIGNNTFVGANSVISEGIMIEDNCVIGMGTFIGKNTKIIDRESGQISYGEIKSGSVVVNAYQDSYNGFNTRIALIVKQIDAQTKNKTSINEILRDS